MVPVRTPILKCTHCQRRGTKQEPRKVLGVGATTLYIPKGKNVYAEGWCNTMFNERRKYTYNGKQFVEVKQPYLYVGMKTTVQPLGSEKAPLILYADKSQQNGWQRCRLVARLRCCYRNQTNGILYEPHLVWLDGPR